jgi:Tetratricopeptide repeat
MRDLKYIGAVVLFLAGMTGPVWAQDQSSQDIQAANAAYGSQNYDQAISDYQAALQGNPNSWQAYQGMGNCYYAKGQYNDALTQYNQALALNPNNPQLSQFVQALQAKVGAAAPAASPAQTAAPASSMVASRSEDSSAGKFEVDPEAGVAVGLSSGYGIGFGGGVFGGIPMKGGLVIGGEVAYFTFNGPSVTYPDFGYGTETDSSSSGSLEILAAAKYRIGEQAMKPFLTAGVGISDLMSSYTVSGLTGIFAFENGSSSGSSINPMVMGGAGLEFAAGKDMHIYAEARLGVVIGNGGTFSYVPVLAGLSLNL